MKSRIISGVLGAIGIIVFSFLGRFWLPAGIGYVIILAAWEYRQLAQGMGFKLSIPLIAGGGLLFLLIATIDFPGPRLKNDLMGPAGFIIFALLFTLLLMELAREDTQNALAKTGVGILGVVYPGLLLSYIILIRRFPEPYGFHLLIFTYCLSWGCDTGAYFVGTLMGKHKLMPRISPKKSVEGAVGGLVIGSTAGILYLRYFGFPLLPWLIVAPVGTIIAQLGDLFESLLKRAAHIKDSGQFLPGHGGVLDRFDSLVFVAPFVYYVALYFIPGK